MQKPVTSETGWLMRKKQGVCKVDFWAVLLAIALTIIYGVCLYDLFWKGVPYLH